MLPLKVIIIVSIVLLVIVAGVRSIRKKDSTLSELVNRELKKQQIAKAGNQNPQVEVIDDPVKVAELRKLLSHNITQAREEAEHQMPAAKRLALRYRQHDRSVIPALLAILNGADVQQRRELYDELSKNYDDPATYTITEPELIKAIFRHFTGTEEPDVIQMAGISRIPGYLPLFEKRFLSGLSADKGRLFFWLADDGTSMAAFDYAEQQIKSRSFSPKELNEVISGMERFAQNGSVQIQARVGQLALFIYNNDLLDRKRYEAISPSISSSDAAETVISCIFRYGDKNAVPVANLMLKRKNLIVKPMVALLRLEGTKHLDKVYDILKNRDDFYTGLDIVEAMDKSLINDQLLREIMRQLGQQKEVRDHVLERIISDFKKWNAVSLLEQPATATDNKALSARLQEMYHRKPVPEQDLMNEMVAAGLLEKSLTSSELAELKNQNQDSQGAEMAFSLLETQKAWFTFDAEADMMPVPYHQLLDSFAAHAGGALKGLLAWSDATEQGNVMQYRVTAVLDNKAYIVESESQDDWYDVLLVQAMVERMLEAKNSKKRFVPFETGDQTAAYIFGEPEKVKAFVEKYRLNQ